MKHPVGRPITFIIGVTWFWRARAYDIFISLKFEIGVLSILLVNPLMYLPLSSYYFTNDEGFSSNLCGKLVPHIKESEGRRATIL